MSKKEFIGFKLDTIDRIVLDTHAKNSELSRTDFIKKAINAEVNRGRLEQEAKREGSDLQKVYQAISEMNSKLDELIDVKLRRVFDRLGRIEQILKIK